MRRSFWTYARVRHVVGGIVRNRPFFSNPWPSEPFYLDIGPGPNASPDFYNIDYEWRPGSDRCLDITRQLDLPSRSISGVYTEHCLEHIPIERCATLLEEVYEALLPGAWIRIVVPDLEIYAREYVRSIDSGQNSMPYGLQNLAGVVAPAIPLNTVMRGHGHQFIYDFVTLAILLERAGFASIKKCSFKVGADPRLLKDADYRQIESLYVEAQRPQ